MFTRRTTLAYLIGSGLLAAHSAHGQTSSPALTGLPVPSATVVPSALGSVASPLPSLATSASGDAAGAMTSTARETRWDASFAAFDAEDKKNKLIPDGVLFVGSSSIRLWGGLQKDFSSMPVVYKRGFGGSRMLDCATHLERLVLRYKPRMVVVYAGDNDLAEGRQPADVLKSFTTFFEGVRAALPETRIAYISIKPSPSRFALIGSIRETNVMIKDYIAQHNNADFIDIFTPMTTPAGQPRPDLFENDMLHMKPEGYAIWTRVILATVQPDTKQQHAVFRP